MIRSESGFRIYRGKLPHWRMSGATYFLTWRLQPGAPELSPIERDVVAETIRHSDGSNYKLHAFVVMNDHVHALLTPQEDTTLERIVRAWKSIASRRIHRERNPGGNLWQREYFDRIVRDQSEFLEKAQYILNNPWKRWPETKEYPWVGAESDTGKMGGSEDPPLPFSV